MTEAMLTLSLIADFTAESKSGILLGLSASSDGSVVAVLGHPLPHSVDAAATWAVVIDRSGMHERPLDPVEIPFGTEVEPQLTSDGSLLLVASRRRGGDNAVLFDPEGWWVRSFAVGDAVESALLDADDSLWVGYFDEGVFGDPLSRPGLARYSLDGRQTWAYAPTPGMAVIEDCYALNVAGSQAWAYSYPSFDLLRVEGHAVARWGTSVAGAHGILVEEGGTVVLVGSSRNPRDVTRWRLHDQELSDPTRLRCEWFPGEGSPRCVGRGPVLWVIDGGVLWRAEVRD